MSLWSYRAFGIQAIISIIIASVYAFVYDRWDLVIIFDLYSFFCTLLFVNEYVKLESKDQSIGETE